MFRLPTRFFVLYLLSASPCLGGENIIKNALNDAGYLAVSPARLARSSVYAVLGGIGAGALIYSFDGQARHLASKNKTASLDSIGKYAEKPGNGGYGLALAGALAGAGCVFKDEKLKDTSLLAVESFLAANAVGTVVKHTAGRSRPYAGNGKRTFKPFSFKSSGTSFPSGHTVSAFSLASVFAGRYENPWVDFAAYGAASASALQRIYADKHWASDVFAGALLGIAAGRAAASLSRSRGPKTAHIFPVYRPGYQGVLVSAGF
ncbi:MAG: phosphatase PAP2 family protein [Elusimicrobia bacterium]|nr:phosphatase PAP2 family protein [Elusimicrobiota bacterium]